MDRQERIQALEECIANRIDGMYGDMFSKVFGATPNTESQKSISANELMGNMLSLARQMSRPSTNPIGFAANETMIEEVKRNGFVEPEGLDQLGRITYKMIRLENYNLFCKHGELVSLNNQAMLDAIVEADKILSNEMHSLNLDGLVLANRIYAFKKAQKMAATGK